MLLGSSYDLSTAPALGVGGGVGVRRDDRELVAASREDQRGRGCSTAFAQSEGRSHATEKIEKYLPGNVTRTSFLLLALAESLGAGLGHECRFDGLATRLVSGDCLSDAQPRARRAPAVLADDFTSGQ